MIAWSNALVAFAHEFVQSSAPLWEPKPFYQARGLGVTAVWSVDRTELPADGILTATLTISGVMNPTEVVRPDLREIAGFTDRFRDIENVPGKPPAPGSKTISFVYRLRPRNPNVDRLPALDFYYFNPTVPEGKQYMNARVKGVPLVIIAPTAPTPIPAERVPLTAPDRLFEVVTGPQVLAAVDRPPPLIAWLGVGLLGPLLAAGWYWGWRWYFPDAARLTAIRRGRAARRALAAIRHAARAQEPVAALGKAVLDYLQSRFSIPATAETPLAIARELRSAGVSPPNCDAVEQFYHRCDELRFGPRPASDQSLLLEAETLVSRLESA